jgi:hypothetical protein
MFNVERGLKIPRKYIASEVNNTRVVNNLLDYSAVNSSLHNLPVNMIFLNMSFYKKPYTEVY